MDPTPWLDAIGGGLAGVVIVAQGFAIYLLWRRVNELSDRFVNTVREMGSESRDLLTSTNTTMSALTTTMTAAVDRFDRGAGRDEGPPLSPRQEPARGRGRAHDGRASRRGRP